MVFRELQIGQTFDWIDDAHPRFNSFFMRCTKVSKRGYVDEFGGKHMVDSVRVAVHHVAVLEELTANK